MHKRATRQRTVLRGDMIDLLDKSKLDRLYAKIIECGQYACAMQQHVVRSFKADGSVLTEADTAISRMIINEIRELFPDAAVISEEDIVENRKDARWIFILDPIDGTDVYSQGMPAFAISLGILNQEHQPVGAMISLPRFGVGCEALNLRMDPYDDAYINGEKFVPYNGKSEARQVTMGSKGMLELDFSRFTGKVRVLGSTIIHILAPLIFNAVDGVVVQRCFAWDIASAHAVMKHYGMDLADKNGSVFSYTDSFIFDKTPLDRILYGGTAKTREILVKALPLKF